MAKYSWTVRHDADCLCFPSAGVCGCVFCAFVSHLVKPKIDMQLIFAIVYVCFVFEGDNAIHLFLSHHVRSRSPR